MRDYPELGKGFKCFRCGEMGHIATHCTKSQGLGASSSGSVSVGRGTNVGRPVGRGGGVGGSTAPGRVFAMTRQNVQATPNVVTGTLMVCGVNAQILIDPGSTHSFVSNLFSVHLNKHYVLLNTALAISTPVGEVVIVGVSFPKCVVSVGGRNLEVDLIPLVMSDFDVILGMDFL
ncbi:uncharacterized protein LOC131306778 [Rhododendron vialii]|uniref:uncharacterized protein LOC131306778 n=1 Tax=Rhododendron vialii TaxID=182163 RepID=UPI00265EFDD3|nr:uncharacterized protein LOC131306778 [Rhododendron vialii]